LKANEIKDFNNEIKKLENLNVLRKKNNLIYLNEKGMLISDNISSRLFLV
jgi:coproporphyrinogen III oxidase-like Fe-S oxidoreductase